MTRTLTIYCSCDLEGPVVTALEAAGVEGYLRIADATGHRFLASGQVPRTMAWEATTFVVPVATDEQVRKATERLKVYARSCEVAPCLHAVAGPAEVLV